MGYFDLDLLKLFFMSIHIGMAESLLLFSFSFK